MTGATLSLAAWRSQVEGQQIGSGQCVALADDYVTRVLGLPVVSAAGGAHDEYASSMWEGFAANGTGANFTQVSPLLPAKAGDLAVWKYGSAIAPYSHVAVVLNDLGVALNLESQNTSGHLYAEQTTLPKAGLYGYIRPLNQTMVKGTGPGVDNAVNIQTAGNVLTDAGALADTWGKMAAWVGDGKNWQRIGIALLGIILIMVALWKVLSPTAAGHAAGSLVKKAAAHVGS